MTRREKLVERIRRRPPTAKFSDVKSLLEEFGWTHDRTKGSHAIFVKPGERTLPVPVHNGDVSRVYLDRICDLLDLDNKNETD
jgi:predicted RNA binding protein YcfA (HicA-like mRNA interferase family)